jgi:hypothetical protein
MDPSGRNGHRSLAVLYRHKPHFSSLPCPDPNACTNRCLVLRQEASEMLAAAILARCTLGLDIPAIAKMRPPRAARQEAGALNAKWLAPCEGAYALSRNSVPAAPSHDASMLISKLRWISADSYGL